MEGVVQLHVLLACHTSSSDCRPEQSRVTWLMVENLKGKCNTRRSIPS